MNVVFSVYTIKAAFRCSNLKYIGLLGPTLQPLLAAVLVHEQYRSLSAVKEVIIIHSDGHKKHTCTQGETWNLFILEQLVHTGLNC